MDIPLYCAVICVGCGAWSTPGAVTACCTCYVLYSGVLGMHLVQEGSGPCISYGVTGHTCIYVLRDMYALMLPIKP